MAIAVIDFVYGQTVNVICLYCICTYNVVLKRSFQHSVGIREVVHHVVIMYYCPLTSGFIFCANDIFSLSVLHTLRNS